MPPSGQHVRSLRPVGFAILAGLLVLAVAGMTLYGHRGRSGSALRKYQAELQAQGEKLTYADLVRGRATNASQSLGPLMAAAAKLGGRPMNPGSLPLRSYAAPGRARVAWRENDPWIGQGRPGKQPWDWDAFAPQVEALQGPLAELREALKDPPPDGGPRTSLLTGPRVNFVALRSAAQWLMGAALSEVRQGRLEEASQDLAALGASGKVDREEYSLVAQMIRVAVTGLGSLALWEALQAPGWSDAQLARLQAGLEDNDLLDGLEKGLLGERVMGAEFATLLRQNPAGFHRYLVASQVPRARLQAIVEDGLLLPIYRLTKADGDGLLQLKTMQSCLELVRRLRAGQPWPKLKAQSATPASPASPAGSRFQPFRLSVSTFILFNSTVVRNNFTRATETTVKGETYRQMTLAALALKRYQLRHGRLPPDLAALAPEFLPAAPRDPMSGNSLLYRLRPDGSFLLYSVGVDGKDDGGDAQPGSGGPGFWEGRDAVWPAAVEATGEAGKDGD